MVRRWLAGYEAAWRAPGTQGLAEVFTEDASYRQSPYQEPVAGLDAIRRMWDEERDGPEEVFTLATEIVAVDGRAAVVRAEVRYGDPLVLADIPVGRHAVCLDRTRIGSEIGGGTRHDQFLLPGRVSRGRLVLIDGPELAALTMNTTAV